MQEHLRILLVDDDIIDRRTARRALQTTVFPDGPVFDVTEADTSASALASLTDGRFDAMVLDFQLPDGNGLDVLREARAAGWMLPVIMLTEYGDDLVAVDLMKAGASDYLSKSKMTPPDFQRAVWSAVRVSRAEQKAQQTDAALREMQQRLMFHVENSPLAAIEWDRDFRIIRWSPQAERIFGWTQAEVLGKGSDEWPFIHPEDAKEVGKGIQNLQQGRETWNIASNRNFRRDGRTVYCEWYNSALHDADGHLVSVLSLVLDQTERWKAEEAVSESEARYRFLSEAMPEIVWLSLTSGETYYYNKRWYEYTGLTEAETLQENGSRVVHPDDLPRVLNAWEAASTKGQPLYIEYRMRRFDGQYRWHLGRVEPQQDGEGEITEWIGTATDIHDQKMAQEGLRFLAEASSVLASSLDYQETLASVARLAVPLLADWCVIDLVDEDGNLHRVDAVHQDPEMQKLAQKVNDQYQFNPDAPSGVAFVIRSGQSELVPELQDEMLDAGIADPKLREVIRSLNLRSYLSVPLNARGRTLGAITLIATDADRHYGPSDLALAEELAQRAALAVDNARLFQETKQRAAREGLLNDISRTLRGVLDEGEILNLATQEVGRVLGVSRCVWCWINRERTQLQFEAQQYNDSDVAPMSGIYPFAAYSESQIHAWSHGQALILNDIASVSGYGSKMIQSLSENKVQAFIACPVFLRGEWEGVFIVQQTDRPRTWTRDEVSLLSSIADMIAPVLENARLYMREHRVADMLQTAFLPDVPDEISGLKLAPIYRAVLEESHVGGDFFDVIPLPAGRVGLVMGDVSGKGLSAAVQTATVKYTLRAFAAEAAAPDLVLTRLNRTLSQESAGLNDHFVTLFYGVYDPASGRLAYASAGHETQLIKRAYGGVTQLEATGPILGLSEMRFEAGYEHLASGDQLLLFTDGLTEARNPQTRETIDLDRIAMAIEVAPADVSPAELASKMKDQALEWAGGALQDDLAILVACRIGEVPRHPLPDETKQNGTDSELLFRFAFASRPDHAAEVRQAVGHWMNTLDYPQSEIEDFQTAVTEAVTNAVRHGSPRGVHDQFTVSGQRLPNGTLAVAIADNGSGPDSRDSIPLMPDPEAVGGRGLPLMHSLADAVEYPVTENGYCVRLLKHVPIR